jgi:hypothetical protein
MRGRAPQAARGRGRGGCLWQTHPNANSFWSVIVRADGTRTATVGNGDFGTSPLLLGSSRTSRCLPVLGHVGCRAQRTMAGREITRRSDSMMEWSGSRASLNKANEAQIAKDCGGEQFYTDAIQPSERRVFFGGEILMSMQNRLPDQVVRADPWTFYCAVCSETMRIKTLAPSQGGMKTRTYRCMRLQA